MTQVPITVEWVNTLCNHHTMEYYTATKKNKLLLCTVTWMNLPSVMLSEKKPDTQKDNLCDTI